MKGKAKGPAPEEVDEAEDPNSKRNTELRNARRQLRDLRGYDSNSEDDDLLASDSDFDLEDKPPEPSPAELAP